MADKKLLILGNPQGGQGGNAVWGDITGTLSDQTDLQNALNAKANSSDLATRKQDLDLSTLNQTEMADFYANYATYKTTYDLNWAGTPIVSINTYVHPQYGTFLVLEFGIYGQNDVMTGTDTTVGFIVKTVAADGSVQDISTTMTFKTVCHTGSYNDLTDKPTIPAAQVNSDWNSASGVSQILNKPSMTTETLTFVDANNVQTTVVVYVQPTV